MAAAMLCLAAAPATADDTSRKSLAAHRAQEPPVLDGRLDDPVWQQASFVEDLHIVVSDEYGAPAERSRIYVAFDDDNLYFAARFWDSRPETVRRESPQQEGRVLRRGRIHGDARPVRPGPHRLRRSTSIRMACGARRSTPTPIARTGTGRASGTRPPTGRRGLDRRVRHPAEDAVLRSVERRLGRQLHALARGGQRAVRLGLVQSQPESLAHGSADRPRRTAAGPRHRRDPWPAHGRDRATTSRTSRTISSSPRWMPSGKSRRR